MVVLPCFFLLHVPLGEQVLSSGRAETDSHRSLDLIIPEIFPADSVQEAPGFHPPADSAALRLGSFETFSFF